jgi:hypothetical protein
MVCLFLRSIFLPFLTIMNSERLPSLLASPMHCRRDIQIRRCGRCNPHLARANLPHVPRRQSWLGEVSDSHVRAIISTPSAESDGA